jgi:hypothetical protein
VVEERVRETVVLKKRTSTKFLIAAIDKAFLKV